MLIQMWPPSIADNAWIEYVKRVSQVANIRKNISHYVMIIILWFLNLIIYCFQVVKFHLQV